MIIGEEKILVAKDGKRRTHKVVECANCGELYYKIKKHIQHHKNHFCGRDCVSEFNNKQQTVTCATCDKKFDIKRHRVKEYNFCSRQCKEIAQSHKGGRLLNCGKPNGETSHRVIALASHGEKCELCGYDKFVNLLDSHHIDHDRSNFDPSNLMVLCVMCHAAETRGLISFDVNRNPFGLNGQGTEFLKHMGSDAKGA